MRCTQGRSASPASTTTCASNSLYLIELSADRHFWWLVETASGAGPGFGRVTIPVQEDGLFLTGGFAKCSEVRPFLPSVPTGHFSFKKMFWIIYYLFFSEDISVMYFQRKDCLEVLSCSVGHRGMYLALNVKTLLLNYWLITFVIEILTEDRFVKMLCSDSEQACTCNILLIKIKY